MPQQWGALKLLHQHKAHNGAQVWFFFNPFFMTCAHSLQITGHSKDARPSQSCGQHRGCQVTWIFIPPPPTSTFSLFHRSLHGMPTLTANNEALLLYSGFRATSAGCPGVRLDNILSITPKIKKWIDQENWSNCLAVLNSTTYRGHLWVWKYSKHRSTQCNSTPHTANYYHNNKTLNMH